MQQGGKFNGDYIPLLLQVISLPFVILPHVGMLTRLRGLKNTHP